MEATFAIATLDISIWTFTARTQVAAGENRDLVGDVLLRSHMLQLLVSHLLLLNDLEALVINLLISWRHFLVLFLHPILSNFSIFSILSICLWLLKTGVLVVMSVGLFLLLV